MILQRQRSSVCSLLYMGIIIETKGLFNRIICPSFVICTYIFYHEQRGETRAKYLAAAPSVLGSVRRPGIAIDGIMWYNELIC